MPDAAELLNEVEGDVGLMGIDCTTDCCEVVRNADREDLVAKAFDGVPDIELGLAQLALFLAEVLEVAFRQQLFIRQHDDAELLALRPCFPGHGGSQMAVRSSCYLPDLLMVVTAM